jgi:hypothetical protein
MQGIAFGDLLTHAVKKAKLQTRRPIAPTANAYGVGQRPSPLTAKRSIRASFAKTA